MDGAKCTQPGCGGTIEGGFCNRCGLEPADAGYAAVEAGGSGLLGGTGSAAIGSARSASAVSSARLGAGSTRRRTDSARSSSRKHLGLGIVAVPELPPLDPETVDHGRPAGAAQQAVLRQSRLPRRPGQSHAADAPRSGILPGLRQALFLRPHAQAGRRGRRSVRGQRLPGLRRIGLGLSGQGHHAQSLGGAQGAA